MVYEKFDGADNKGLGQSLFEDFTKHFTVVYANSDDLKRIAYSIRHYVYCEDLGLEPAKKHGMAIDGYDAYAHHILLQHNQTGRYAGSIRLITPELGSQRLPIHGEEIQRSWANRQALTSLKLGEYSEISKLAVPDDFHQREVDRLPLNQSLGPPDTFSLATGPHRDFPKITMGLYLAAIALARQLFHDHVYAVMAPMLFKKLRGYGLLFDQASHVFENSGAKAVYHLNMEQGVRIAQSIYPLHDAITRQLASQLPLLPDVKEAL